MKGHIARIKNPKYTPKRTYDRFEIIHPEFIEGVVLDTVTIPTQQQVVIGSVFSGGNTYNTTWVPTTYYMVETKDGLQKWAASSIVSFDFPKSVTTNLREISKKEDLHAALDFLEVFLEKEKIKIIIL